jgi:hypothetical protein
VLGEVLMFIGVEALCSTFYILLMV